MMGACQTGGGRGQEVRRGVATPVGAVTRGSAMGGAGLRGARSERRCAGVVDLAALASGEINEDPLDAIGSLDARDDAQRAATDSTVFDADVEHALEPLHPTHGGRWRMGFAGGAGRARLGTMWWRCLKFGANTPWYQVRWARGRGTERARCASGTSGAVRRTIKSIGSNTT